MSKHDLTQANSVDLMDRVDSKFIFLASELHEILNQCMESYSLLEIMNENLFEYKNTYFDSPKYHFYLTHHNKKLNRKKVRIRSYVSSEKHFLEIKQKTNKGRTIKVREEITEINRNAVSHNRQFLREEGVENCECLEPKQYCNYHRFSLMDNSSTERLTFDLGTNYNCSGIGSYDTPDNNRNFSLGNIVIAELKQSKLERQSTFYKVMREKGYRPNGFSKYCMGIALSRDVVLKSNRFKRNMLKIQQEVQ